MKSIAVLDAAQAANLLETQSTQSALHEDGMHATTLVDASGVVSILIQGSGDESFFLIR